jgi:hypothetical protein
MLSFNYTSLAAINRVVLIHNCVKTLESKKKNSFKFGVVEIQKQVIFLNKSEKKMETQTKKSCSLFF